MPPTIPFPSAQVPLVGQPTKVVQHYHTFVMQCQCPTGFVSVIVGGGEGMACPGCGGVPMVQLTDGKIEIGMRRAPGDLN